MPTEIEEIKGMFSELLSKLKKPGSKIEIDDEDDEDDDYNNGKGKVPASEMRRSSRARKKAEAEAKALRAEIEALKAEIPATLSAAEKAFKKTVDELKAQAATDVTAVREGFDRNTLLNGYGLNDDLSRKAALDAYGSLPEAGRPALKEQLEIWKTKPETRPRTIGSFFGEADTGTGGRIPGTAGGTKGADTKKDVSKMTSAELDALIRSIDA